MLGLDSVADWDDTCRAGRYSNMEWVTVSSDSPNLGQ